MMGQVLFFAFLYLELRLKDVVCGGHVGDLGVACEGHLAALDHEGRAPGI